MIWHKKWPFQAASVKKIYLEMPVFFNAKSWWKCCRHPAKWKELLTLCYSFQCFPGYRRGSHIRYWELHNFCKETCPYPKTSEDFWGRFKFPVLVPEYISPPMTPFSVLFLENWRIGRRITVFTSNFLFFRPEHFIWAPQILALGSVTSMD